EQQARNAQHGGSLQRGRGGRAPRLGEQRQLAEQRQRPDRDFLAVLGGGENEATALHDVAAVGVLAGQEQYLAAVQVAGLAADRQDAQRLTSELAERRHALEEADVVLDGHAAIVRAPACSRPPRSPGWKASPRPSQPSGAADRCGSRACGW